MLKVILNVITQRLSGVLVIAFVALIWYSYDTTMRLRKAQWTSDALETTISDMSQKIERYEIQINDSTKLHAATVKNLRMTADNIQAKYNELLAASSIKKKDVNNVTVIGTEAKDTVYVPTEVDSFGGLQTGYKDPFIDISVNINTERMATIAYTSRDSLSLIEWKSLEKTTVINHNPNATVSSLQTIDVIE